MEEAEKAIYPADTGHEVQPRISSEQYQMREVCVWIPKRRAHEARGPTSQTRYSAMRCLHLFSQIRDPHLYVKTRGS